jgi:DNA-binding transcriptional LysR family regulator
MTMIETDIPLMRYEFPPMNTLRTIEAVVRNGSIRRAADRLCITPQDVSEQLKQLEQALHRELFYQRDSSIEPTPAAHTHDAMLEATPAAVFSRVSEAQKAANRADRVLEVAEGNGLSGHAHRLSLAMQPHVNASSRARPTNVESRLRPSSAGSLD